MQGWLIVTLLVVGILSGYFAGEYFRPKVISEKHDTTYVDRKIEVQIDHIVIKQLPAKLMKLTTVIHDTVTLLQYARLDTTVINAEGSKDTLQVEYHLSPVNEWKNIYVGMAPRHSMIQERVVFVDKTVEKSQFLGGYPEKLLYFVGGYGAALLINHK